MGSQVRQLGTEITGDDPAHFLGVKPELTEVEPQLSPQESIAQLAENLASEAEAYVEEAERLAIQARFTDLIARGADGDDSVRFYYARMDEDDRPAATGGDVNIALATVNEFGEEDGDTHVIFHFSETPQSLTAFSSGWHPDHPRKGNVFTIRFGGVRDLEMHGDTNHVRFRSAANRGAFTYLITDEPFAARDAHDIALDTVRFIEEEPLTS